MNTDGITEQDNLISVQMVDTENLELIYNRKSELDMRERLIARNTKYTTHGKEFTICKTEQDTYIIFFAPQNGDKIAIECKDINELDNILEKIVLNYQIALMKGFPLTFTSKSSRRIDVENSNLFGIRQKQSSDCNVEYEIGVILNNLRSIFGLSPDPEIAQNYTKDDAIMGRIDLDKNLGLLGLYEEEKPKSEMEYAEYTPIDFYTQEKRASYKFIIDNLTDEQKRLLQESFKRIRILYEVKEKAPTSYALTTENELLLNGRGLYNTREALKMLAEVAKVNGNGSVYDFEKAGIDSTIQNYLLEYLYGYRFVLDENQKKALENFKYVGFGDINSYLRGIIDKKRGFTAETLGSIVDDIIRINAIARALPKRDFDIVIRRIGLGTSKNNDVGSENKYDSFVSFATNGGTRMGNTYDVYNQYERILKGDETAIPMDLICYSIWPDRESECEMLVMPFAYSVEECIPRMNCFHIKMGNIQTTDILQILRRRIEETKREYGIARKEKAFKKYPKVLEDSEMAQRGYEESKIDVEQIDFLGAMRLFKACDDFEDFLMTDNLIQTDSNQYKKSELHGVNHTRRVSFNVRLLADIDGLSEEDKKILLTAAMYHDIGRVNDDEDPSHGAYSVKKMKSRQLISEFSEEDQELIYFLIYEHSLPKRKNKEDISGLKPGLKERYSTMLKYLKDADKLDRVRLGRYDGLNPSRLELPTSQRLVKLAYQSYLYFKSYVEYEQICRIHDMAKHLEDRIIEEIERPYAEKVSTEEIHYYDDKEVEEDKDTRKETTTNIPDKRSPYTDVIEATKGIVSLEEMRDVVDSVMKKYGKMQDYSERV